MKSRVNILVISTDHYEKDKYEQYRKGASYNQFIENIQRVDSLRSLYLRTNSMYTRASGVAVDQSMDIEKFNEFYRNFFDESATVRMSERWDTYSNPIDPQDTRACGLPFERLYIWYDGTTNPCDTDYKSYLSPGNVSQISIAEAWTNLAGLRQSMESGNRQLNTPCDRCYVA